MKKLIRAPMSCLYGVSVATIMTLLSANVALLYANEETRDVVTPYTEIKFPPLTQYGQSKATAAELWGDPEKGPSSMLIRFTKGSTHRHYHSADYQLVVVQGTVTHWTEGLPDAGAKRLGPGSFWYQPGREVHQDTCLVDECMLFAIWMGKEDTIIVDK